MNPDSVYDAYHAQLGKLGLDLNWLIVVMALNEWAAMIKLKRGSRR